MPTPDPRDANRQYQDMMDRIDRPATREESPTTLRDAHRLLGRGLGREVSRPPVTPDRRSPRR